MTRARLVTALVVLASALLVAATLTAYAWRVFFDSGQFADRAVATLQDERVRTVVADRVTDELIVPRNAPSCSPPGRSSRRRRVGRGRR